MKHLFRDSLRILHDLLGLIKLLPGSTLQSTLLWRLSLCRWPMSDAQVKKYFVSLVLLHANPLGRWRVPSYHGPRENLVYQQVVRGYKSSQDFITMTTFRLNFLRVTLLANPKAQWNSPRALHPVIQMSSSKLLGVTSAAFRWYKMRHIICDRCLCEQRSTLLQEPVCKHLLAWELAGLRSCSTYGNISCKC